MGMNQALTWFTLVCHSLVMWKPRLLKTRSVTAWPGRPPMLKIMTPVGLIMDIPSSAALATKPNPN
jgi:hypothetical protein